MIANLYYKIIMRSYWMCYRQGKNTRQASCIGLVVMDTEIYRREFYKHRGEISIHACEIRNLCLSLRKSPSWCVQDQRQWIFIGRHAASKAKQNKFCTPVLKPQVCYPNWE